MRHLLAIVLVGACAPSAIDLELDAGSSPPDDAGADAAGPPVCGDGLITWPETCDPPGSCPAECPPQTCSVGQLGGAPATCDVACTYEPVTACAAGDGCCPSGCELATDADCTGIRLDAAYEGDYELQDLGPVPGVPVRLGGLVVAAGDPGRLLVGGSANTAEGTLYEIGVQRDGDQHIVGFVGTATVVAQAAYNDGGIVYGPGGVLFLARWPVNELGQTRPGSGVTDKVASLATFGVASSVAGLVFVPEGYPGAGQLKAMSWGGGEWYTLPLAPDAAGTFDVLGATPGPVLTGGPEGMVYVPAGSPRFPVASLLVSEWSAGRVATYEVDAQGDPAPATRREFVIGLTGAEGATIDPTSGDFLFSTFGGGDRVIVVRGFNPIE